MILAEAGLFTGRDSRYFLGGVMADDIIYINVDEGLNRVMKNSVLYNKLLGKFKNDTAINDIENAFAQGDTEKAKVSSHTLKGLAANLSFSELYKQVLELETQFKAGAFNNEQMALVRTTYDRTLLEIDKVINSYV